MYRPESQPRSGAEINLPTLNTATSKERRVAVPPNFHEEEEEEVRRSTK
jgi:hypothetical protein